jgi:hypothetical protein
MAASSLSCMQKGLSGCVDRPGGKGVASAKGALPSSLLPLLLLTLSYHQQLPVTLRSLVLRPLPVSPLRHWAPRPSLLPAPSSPFLRLRPALLLPFSRSVASPALLHRPSSALSPSHPSQPSTTSRLLRLNKSFARRPNFLPPFLTSSTRPATSSLLLPSHRSSAATFPSLRPLLRPLPSSSSTSSSTRLPLLLPSTPPLCSLALQLITPLRRSWRTRVCWPPGGKRRRRGRRSRRWLELFQRALLVGSRSVADLCVEGQGHLPLSVFTFLTVVLSFLSSFFTFSPIHSFTRLFHLSISSVRQLNSVELLERQAERGREIVKEDLKCNK